MKVRHAIGCLAHPTCEHNSHKDAVACCVFRWHNTQRSATMLFATLAIGMYYCLNTCRTSIAPKVLKVSWTAQPEEPTITRSVLRKKCYTQTWSLPSCLDQMVCLSQWVQAQPDSNHRASEHPLCLSQLSVRAPHPPQTPCQHQVRSQPALLLP